MQKSLGLIETKGLVTCIRAADAMGKAADVTLTGFDNVGSGMVSVMVSGDVGAVTAAVEVGVQAAMEVGEVVSYKVIPRPSAEANKIISTHRMPA